MANCILTGAGFSKNWGGWLSSELWGYLLGHTDIQKNDALKALLLKNRQQGFENALEEAKQNSLTGEEWKVHYKTLENVVIEAFDEMDILFKGTYKEFGQTRYMMEKFIAKFDIFFTTNQDLLVERQFKNLENGLAFQKIGKKNITTFLKPGVKNTRVDPMLGPADHFPTWTPDESQIGKLGSNIMPYIKLHGCMKGRSSLEHLMIMGGQKDDQIAKEPLIKWYFEIFKEKLSEPKSRLLVLGHSFLDPHINKIIFDAVKDGNLKFYIWNTSGLDKIFENLEKLNQRDYTELFKKELISINTKSLKELFLQDSLLEHELDIVGRMIFV